MAKVYRVIRINFSLRNDHRITNKAYLSAITVTNIYQSFYLQDGGKKQLA